MKTSLIPTRPNYRDASGIRLRAALVASLCLCACKKPELPKPPPPVVEVIRVETSEVPLQTSLIGQLDSPQNVEIRARVEGFVDKMPFREGVEVKQDDVLFELDQKPFLEKLAAANGALAEAHAALNKYEKDVARLAPLVARKAIPLQDLDNAEASVDVGKAGVLTAMARVESAQLDLGYCVVKAPITGLIGATQVSIGELVGKGEPTLLATISTLDPIWFYCNVSEVEYLKAEAKSNEQGLQLEKLPLHLVLSGEEKFSEEGRFVFLDRAVNAKTGTLRIRAEFPNKKKVLRPGMFARVRVDLGTRKNCLQVPQRALVELQGRNFLWIITPENTASQRPVKVGEGVGSNVLILDGLKVGEHVVVEGLQKIREGAPVQVVEHSAAAINPEKK